MQTEKHSAITRRHSQIDAETTKRCATATTCASPKGSLRSVQRVFLRASVGCRPGEGKPDVCLLDGFFFQFVFDFIFKN